MTTTPDLPNSDLRAADEDTVLDAIDASDVGDAMQGIAPVVLLEFFNAMLDPIDHVQFCRRLPRGRFLLSGK
jgi:hypothetical protein